MDQGGIKYQLVSLVTSVQTLLRGKNVNIYVLEYWLAKEVVVYNVPVTN